MSSVAAIVETSGFSLSNLAECFDHMADERPQVHCETFEADRIFVVESPTGIRFATTQEGIKYLNIGTDISHPIPNMTSYAYSIRL